MLNYNTRRRNGCIVWDEVDYQHADSAFFTGLREGWREMFFRNNIVHDGAGILNSVK